MVLTLCHTDLVRATFKDANGYVEGLTQEQLDKWIAEVKAHRAPLGGKSPDVAQQLKTISTTICNKLHALAEHSTNENHLLVRCRVGSFNQSVY